MISSILNHWVLLLALCFAINSSYGATFEDTRSEAVQGNLQAQADLGLMYLRGEVVPRDTVAALSWWRKAAAQGNATGQVMLGQSYEAGVDVPQDLCVAMFWFAKAGAQVVDSQGIPDDRPTRRGQRPAT